MNRFKEKKTQLLVATDVAARGIDVDKLTHVINYNLPDGTEAYVHRSGRTGRAHNSGISLVIVNMREKYKIRHLESATGKKFEQARIPNGDDICEKQLFSLIEKVKDIEVSEDQISRYLEAINKKFENMDREELIKKFVSVEFNRFLKHYKNAIDLNSNVGKENDRGSRKSSILFARFEINVGKGNGLDIKQLFHFLNSQQELRGVEIGNISMDRDSTQFEVDETYKEKVLEAFQGSDMSGVDIDISCTGTGIVSTRPPKSGGGRRRSGGGGGSRGRSYSNDRSRSRSRSGSRSGSRSRSGGYSNSRSKPSANSDSRSRKTPSGGRKKKRY